MPIPKPRSARRPDRTLTASTVAPRVVSDSTEVVLTAKQSSLKLAAAQPARPRLPEVRQALKSLIAFPKARLAARGQK